MKRNHSRSPGSSRSGASSFPITNPKHHGHQTDRNYSKRLGLPGYSSHQFSVSVETELVATDDIPGESQRLYQLLQRNVDEQILTTGFVPPADYGMQDAEANVTPIDRNSGSGETTQAF